MQGLKQYYFKQGKSLYISKYFIEQKNSPFFDIDLLKINVNFQNIAKKLSNFWLFFYITGQLPYTLQKKTRSKLHVKGLSINLRKDRIFSFLEKLLSIYIPNTTYNNLKFVISENKIFGKISKCSGYVETDNLFYKDRNFQNFSMDLEISLKKKLKSNFFLKFLQIPT